MKSRRALGGSVEGYSTIQSEDRRAVGTTLPSTFSSIALSRQEAHARLLLSLVFQRCFDFG